MTREGFKQFNHDDFPRRLHIERLDRCQSILLRKSIALLWSTTDCRDLQKAEGKVQRMIARKLVDRTELLDVLPTTSLNFF
ncbi:hypothetical protein Bcep18194_A4945 [Burkholderia lata]|uniref:Uncharacterized protein n=1 Tax=Burkholderia lata (strain ATCC 17760 / DSM 23089 / LMG 22485 / NCIMB 9086 / R18194 / 383) TaxID=482957 RepID=Q39G77_BURL3|nr:hypothetical protein Bcep18194_A4945 [Burkholderia lata]